MLAGAISLKCVAWGHLFEVCGLGHLRGPIRCVAVARGHLSMIYLSLSNLNLDGPRPHTLELMA